MNRTLLFTFIPTSIFYAVSFFAPNNKVFFGLYILYLIVLYLLHGRQWKDVLFVGYIASLPLAAGKKIAFDLVSFREFNLLMSRPFGISADIIVTMGDMCIALMGLVLLKDMVFGSDRKKYRDTVSTALLFYFGAIVVATVYGSIRPEISLLHALFMMKPLVLYWFVTHHVDRHVVWIQTMTVLAAVISLEVLMSGIQMVRQGPIGSVLELAPDYIPYDTSSDSGQIFRPVGSFYHANVLAHFLLPIVCILFPFLFIGLSGMGSGFFISSMIIGVGGLLLTLSRSAWISGFVGVFIYIWLAEKFWYIRVSCTHVARRILMWWAIPILLAVVLFVLPRVVNTVYTFDRYGSAQTRVLLLHDAADAAREHPIFGVGLDMDLYFMYMRSVQRRVTRGVEFFIPEPVHNGYMRLLLQTGIVGCIGFFVALFVLLGEQMMIVRSARSKHHKLVIAGVVAGITAVCINSLMQPLLPNIHDIVLFIILSKAYYKSRVMTSV